MHTKRADHLNNSINQFGIQGTAFKLLRSYLTNRYQYTKTEGVILVCRHVSYGDFQRSSLGQLLFLVRINDLSKCSLFKIIPFADDIYLMQSNKGLRSLEKNVNNELGKIDHCL